MQTKPLVIAATVAAAVATVLRRRQAAADANVLWREATSDESR